GCAVIHLSFITSAFAYVFDRKTKEIIEYSNVLPPLGQTRFDRHPDKGICRFKSMGALVEMIHDLEKGRRRIQVDFASKKIPLVADIEVIQPAGQVRPLHFLMPMGKGKNAFTTKTAGLTAKGSIRIHDKTIEIDENNSFAVFDWTNGFYNRQTFWNWACGSGRTDNGTRIGFNFSKGVYENGRLENVIWLDGQPILTDEAIFTYSSKAPLSPWKIETRDQAISLVFKPEGMRQANENFGIVISKFIQPCGTFEGIIRPPKGEVLTFSDVGGVAEEHYAKW
ncbi:MAG: DUF2804 domain-containing protein, partial [Desulfobacteraceae bacterium]|nr:DUF2804 domain-containing protein [Desulfobacteraceae bacterium]